MHFVENDPSFEAKNPTVLIIDDDHHNMSIMSNLLSSRNYDVLVAEDGESGIARAAFAVPDIIFLDVRMPRMDGYETCRRLKMLDGVKDIPVIFLTATTSTEDKLRGFEVGAVDFVSKPYQPEEVLSRTAAHLRIRELSLRLQKANKSMETVFTCIQDGIITFDITGKITKFNTAAKNICRITDEYQDQCIESINPSCSGSCRKIVAESQSSVSTVRSDRIECGCSTYPQRIVSLTASPLLDSHQNSFGTVLVIRDETLLDNLEREKLERDRKKSRYSDYMVGRSKKMQAVFSMIEELSSVTTTVIINGESGSGKELVASALHKSGNRRNNPFVKVNCAAIQDSLLESELFGHVKGAFTGAHSNRIGRFEMADGGTIFLDEIGDISPHMQTRLLRVLQEKEFERVGDSTSKKINVRVITATNQNLAEKVRRGEFREDLFYRLKVFTINLPPLRERKGDIPLLASHFISELVSGVNKTAVNISSEVMKLFMDYAWPGNIRELRNVIEYALVRCRGTVILSDHLPPDFFTSFYNTAEDDNSIELALVAAGGNKSKAAKALNIDRKTLYRKLEKLNTV